MNKKIKDYLHLYLGSWINVLNEVTGEYSIDRKMTPSDLNLILNYNKKVNLHLRPLSDMTEEEDKESSRVWFAEVERQGKIDIHVYAVMTNWFRKKEFDVDGLIESGLAIDKTKINAEQEL